VLKDVKHITDLRLNLVSASKLDDAGYSINLNGRDLKLIRDSLIMAQGNKCCSLIVGHEMNVVDYNSSLDCGTCGLDTSVRKV